jgi:hypothetical protein
MFINILLNQNSNKACGITVELRKPLKFHSNNQQVDSPINCRRQ